MSEKIRFVKQLISYRMEEAKCYIRSIMLS